MKSKKAIAQTRFRMVQDPRDIVLFDNPMTVNSAVQFSKKVRF